jgi:hypothetical protein
MTNGLLIYGEIFSHFRIDKEALPHIWLCNCSTPNFIIYEEILVFFFIIVYYTVIWKLNCCRVENLNFFKGKRNLYSFQYVNFYVMFLYIFNKLVLSQKTRICTLPSTSKSEPRNEKVTSAKVFLCIKKLCEKTEWL